MKASLVPAARIERAILPLRGHKVLLDADLAALYEVPTKALLQAVRRKLERFPQDFMFQLDKQEFAILLEVTNCDLKLGRPAHGALRLHRAGRGHAFYCP